MKTGEHHIAILCTGDEIVNGDVIDTNAPYIAQQLAYEGFHLGTRLTIADNKASLAAAISYLLQDHSTLITIGGLGPTSDDCTRFALSKALNQPLIFDQESWQRILTRFHQSQREPTANNRQQCEFPEGAIIYPNENGTASGCAVKHNAKMIFMLPGPPNECRPLFDHHVLNSLKQHYPTAHYYHRQWMLLNVSESSIADQIDPIVKGSDCQLAYCVSNPYVKLSLKSVNHSAIDQVAEKINLRLSRYHITYSGETASELLMQYFMKHQPKIAISDTATRGALFQTILSPDNIDYIAISPSASHYNIKITGMDAYWGKKDSGTNEIIIEILEKQPPDSPTKKIIISIKSNSHLIAATENICHHLLKYFNTKK